MKEKSINKSATKGVTWNLANRLVSNLGQLTIYFVLARLLSPGDFGIIAILGVFVNLSRVFGNAGLGSSIIQDGKFDQEKFSSIFTSSLVISLLIGILMYFIAPFISSFYSEVEDLTFYIRLSIPTIIFGTLNSIQISVLQRDLNFKAIFFSTTIPIIISGIISIIMAYYGFGILSLLVNAFLCSFISFIYCFLVYVKIPKLHIKSVIVKKSLNFSYKILLSSLLEEINRGVFVLLVGMKFGKSVLGNYNMGRQVPGFITSTINATAASVLFPYYSRLEITNQEMSILYRKILMVLNFLIIPFIFLVFLISENLVLLIFTEKWVDSIYFFNMFSIILGVHHVHTNVTYYLNSVGLSNVTLKYDFIKKALGILILIVTIPFGINMVVIGQLSAAILSVLIMAFPTKKYLNLSFFTQFVDLFEIITLNFVVFLMIYSFDIFIEVGYFSILLYPILYLVLYVTISYFFKLKSYQATIIILKNFLGDNLRFKSIK